MDLDFDAVALVALAHGRLLRLLSGMDGAHYQGLATAARHSRLPNVLKKKLVTLEAAHNVCRHITRASVDSLIHDVTRHLRDRPVSRSSSVEGSFASSGSASCTRTSSTRPPSSSTQTIMDATNHFIVDDPITLVQAAVLNACARDAAALAPRRAALGRLFDAAMARAPDSPSHEAAPAPKPVVVISIDSEHDPLHGWEPPRLDHHLDAIAAAAASSSAFLAAASPRPGADSSRLAAYYASDPRPADQELDSDFRCVCALRAGAAIAFQSVLRLRFAASESDACLLEYSDADTFALDFASSVEIDFPSDSFDADSTDLGNAIDDINMVQQLMMFADNGCRLSLGMANDAIKDWAFSQRLSPQPFLRWLASTFSFFDDISVLAIIDELTAYDFG